MQPSIERLIEETVGDSPAASGAPLGRPLGRGHRPRMRGSSGGSLSHRPPKLLLMDGSEDEGVVQLRVSKVFHSITCGAKGCSLAVLWIEVAISLRKSLEFSCFMDENVFILDENCTLWMRMSSFWIKTAFMDVHCYLICENICFMDEKY